MTHLISAFILILYVFGCIGAVTVMDLIFYALETDYREQQGNEKQ